MDSGGGDLTVDAISATDDADMVCDDATNTRIECPYPMIPYVASLPRLRLSNTESFDKHLMLRYQTSDARKGR